MMGALQEGNENTEGVTGSEQSSGPSQNVADSNTNLNSRTTTATANQSGSRKRFHMPWQKKEPEQEKPYTDTADNKKEKPSMTLRSQLWAIFGSWVNILLLLAPVGIAVNYAGVDGTVVFVVRDSAPRTFVLLLAAPR